MSWTKTIKGFWKLNFDGASRGNPGPAAYGWILRDCLGSPNALGGGCIGRNTSDLAEAEGLLRGINFCLHHRPPALCVKGDSQTVINLMKDGKTKNGFLRPKIEEVREFRRRINCPVEFQQINRSANKSADWLANWALDNKLAKDLTVYEDEIKKREDFRELLDLINEEAS
ncbi:hypothetical protein SUGI_1494530 [Cryptomeria japonica]|uniref:RNase H type-1 domain-containing protein n=1 Tax=Cryptomeria japonica TaxID=3369 RepID=A0AAD3NT02_CRYJA|nr:hypothetical protein SUGI_1413570 [Cryptomeria japonica]GLJ59151.1 hypothetical protein SUGI_1494530 [Cryptomeria japonica]